MISCLLLPCCKFQKSSLFKLRHSATQALCFSVGFRQWQQLEEIRVWEAKEIRLFISPSLYFSCFATILADSVCGFWLLWVIPLALLQLSVGLDWIIHSLLAPLCLGNLRDFLLLQVLGCLTYPFFFFILLPLFTPLWTLRSLQINPFENAIYIQQLPWLIQASFILSGFKLQLFFSQLYSFCFTDL